MDELKVFIPFTKKDDDKKEVSGYASTEALDSQGEVVEKEAVMNALPGYLGEYEQDKGRYRYGNLREMHQLSAVGKTMGAKIDNKGLFIKGKIVDDSAWKKVKEGVYAGYSIGGKILKQVKNRIKQMRLTEISLVDRPANPEAVFTMVKIDKAGKAKEMQSIPTIPQAEVVVASHLLELARDIRMLLNMFESEGRSTIELEKALTALKKLAVKVLSETDKKKFEKILYEINFEEATKTTFASKDKPVAKQKKEIDVSKYINNNWSPGYFEDLKKAIG